MTRVAATSVPPWGLAVVAMLTVQLGSALSLGLVSSIGPAGTAWLRLTAGALVLLVLVRPSVREVRRQDLPALLGLGVAIGLLTICFLAAIARIPLGTAVAVEFLGPLSVAALRSHSRRALAWPGLALVGVLLLTEPWHGAVNLAGVGFAALAAVGWAVYIVLTQRVGDRFAGTTGIALTLPIAAATAAVVGIPQAAGQLNVGIIAAAAGLAILHPVLPFALEMLALQRMTAASFGTLMAIEPAIGLLLGLAVLQQRPTVVQAVGILLVVIAGAAAQRSQLRGDSSRQAEVAPGKTVSRR